MLRVGPGASWAVETGRLVHAEQCFRAFDGNVLLNQMLADCLEGTPAASRVVVGMNGLSIGHRDTSFSDNQRSLKKWARPTENLSKAISAFPKCTRGNVRFPSRPRERASCIPKKLCFIRKALA
jgi:hypothetical protein